MVRHRSLILATEFGALYLAAPIVFAVALPPDLIWYALPALTAIAIALLLATPQFRWRRMIESWGLRHWRFALLFLSATALTGLAVTYWLRPWSLFWMPRHNLELWVAVMTLYPILSAAPQEIFYRTLFHERYSSLFPDRRWEIALNGACFGLAHLFLWNAPAVILSAAGGAAFAWAYRGARSFPLAFVLHAVAGQILFTIGAGGFFYHGAAG